MALRDYRMDNLRCVLIVLVVFCHLMVRFAWGPVTGTLYQVIYVFHMPTFVFVSGYFARWRPAKVVRNLLIPYVQFQLLAVAYNDLLAGREPLSNFTLLVPEWTLWYLLACMLWYATCPLLERARTQQDRLKVVGIAFVASILAGCIPWIGKTLSLSRVFAFYPFFCAGFYAGKLRASQIISSLSRPQLWQARLASLAAVAVLMALHFAHGAAPAVVLHRSLPYSSAWDFVARTLLQLAACAWCALLLVITPSQELAVVSEVGRNTMSIYLLHPWVIHLLMLLHLSLLPNEALQLLFCAVVTIGTCVRLGTDRVSHMVCWWNRIGMHQPGRTPSGQIPTDGNRRPSQDGIRWVDKRKRTS
ncbi:MAG: acyltransferase family protein [Atopobiaceae bacterium]|nr:acyltransferase family protein [Atopobiaceae bacterium]